MEKVFSALADNNRRKIIELLHKEDSTLLELSDKFPVSFQALSKHIKILESAEIITKRRKGKYKLLSLNRKSLRSTLEWISFYSSFWEESFDKLEEQIKQENGDKE
jgi:DNA-binding transcriptional ArsR family regulator